MNLEGTYGVFLDGQNLGTASVVRRGLYYEVSCRCRTRGEQMQHLIMEGEHFSEDLGLIIPNGSLLELKRRIPVKRVGEGTPTFYLRSRNAQPDTFVPVKSDLPFLYLHRLNECSFAVQNGQVGISIKA